MDWSVDFEKQKVVGAQFGGPIAIRRDESKIVLMEGDINELSGIKIFTSSGVILCTLPTLHGDNKIIKMGWTNKEQLVVIYR